MNDELRRLDGEFGGMTYQSEVIGDRLADLEAERKKL